METWWLACESCKRPALSWDRYHQMSCSLNNVVLVSIKHEIAAVVHNTVSLLTHKQRQMDLLHIIGPLESPWADYSGLICGRIQPKLNLHQQYVNRSGSHIQTSQTLRSPPPVLLNNSICSQAPLKICKVLSDSAGAFSGAPESTCSYRGAVRMPRYLTYRIVTSWSSWDLCAGLQETSWRILTAVVS